MYFVASVYCGNNKCLSQQQTNSIYSKRLDAITVFAGY